MEIKTLFGRLSIVLGFVCAPYSHATLIGYYNLDDTADDKTALNINLTAIGDPTYVTGMNAGLGKAISLDGIADGLIGQNFTTSATNDLSVIAWVYADSAPTWASIAKHWGNQVGSFHLGFRDNTGRLNNFADAAGSITDDSNGAFPLAAWHHVAFVLDSSTGSHNLYLDGALVDSAAYDGILSTGTATGFGIGVKPNDTGTTADSSSPGFWDGMIDEVGIYDNALSQTEIQAIIADAQNGITLDGTGAAPPPAGVPVASTLPSVLLGALGLAVGLRRKRSACKIS